MEAKQLPLNLDTTSTPAIAIDGHALQVNNDSGDTNLVFFQIVPSAEPKPQQLNASAVANVRLTYTQLGQLSDVLSKAIKNYEQSKKPKTK